MTRPSVAKRCRGMTLVEMIVALVIIGVLAGITASFMRFPVEASAAGRGRADLSERLGFVVQKMDSDLRNALPNSVRLMTVGNMVYLEFVAVRASGRYRPGSGGPANACAGGNQLDLGASDNCFTVLGTVNNGAQILLNQDYLVVNNSSPAVPTKALVTGYTALVSAGEGRINFASTNFPSTTTPSGDFFIVSGPVTYACNTTTPSPLQRYAGYAMTAAQAVPPTANLTGVLMDRLTCRLQYINQGSSMGEGLVVLELTLTAPSRAGLSAERSTLLAQIPVRTKP